MSNEELLSFLNSKKAKAVTWNDLFCDRIDVNYLKRIDKFFKKGLNYYLDPHTPHKSSESSVFFRKSKFNAELNLESKRIVSEFEDKKLSLSAMAKLSDYNFDRKIPIFHTNQNAKEVAKHLRKDLLPVFFQKKREFLKGLIDKLAEFNIFVFEFIETWNKKNTANIDGFFLNPNVIVLKRQQESFSREIFTLAHELGHYLLNEEEAEEVDIVNSANNNLSIIERWCNDFAYNFLLGDFSKDIDDINKFDASNDYGYELINEISGKTHLSKIAIFTNLLLQNKLSKADYYMIKSEIEENWRKKFEEEETEKELAKLEGREQRDSVPKPIQSPLFIDTLRIAFYDGIIGENDFCKSMNISPNKITKYLSI